MTTIIIEDEKPAARLLQRKLEKLNIHVDVMLHSVEESLHWFAENDSPDLIFLDIQLSDGLSFEIFDKVHVTSAMIFTTAYDEYALKAFKLNSIDYLLKPIDEDELAKAVQKYQSGIQRSQMNVNFDQIRNLFLGNTEKSTRTRFTIKVGNRLKVIDLDDVECFYSENKGTYIHTFDNRDFLIDSSLETLENELNSRDFFRISRKFIVPMKAVREIILYSNSRLKLILPSYKDDEVIVSREKVHDFKHWLG